MDAAAPSKIKGQKGRRSGEAAPGRWRDSVWYGAPPTGSDGSRTVEGGRRNVIDNQQRGRVELTTRRRFLVGLSLSAAAGLLAACSPAPAAPAAAPTAASGGGAATPAAAQAAPTVASAGAGKVTITWIEWLSPEMGEENMARVIAAFNQKQPDITVQRLSMPFAGVHDKTIALLAAKQLPDIIEMEPPFMPEYADKGVLQHLNHFIAKEGADFMKQYAQGLVEPAYKGNYNYLPKVVNPNGYYYNKALLEKAGLQHPPTTWQEEIDFGQKATNASANMYAYTSHIAQKSPYNGAPNEVYPRIIQGGSDIVNADGTAAFANDKGVAGLQQYVDLVNKYKIMSPGTLSNEETNKTEAFAAGQNAFMYDNMAHIPLYDKRTELKYGITTVPKGERTGTTAAGWSMGMSSGTKNPDAVWTFMKWITGPEGDKIFATEAKQLPANQQATGGPWEQDERLKAALMIVKDPNTKRLSGSVEQWRVLTEAIQQVLQGKMNAKDALDKAKEDWDKAPM
jgi:multiple sugar transport system substrate-binding protein